MRDIALVTLECLGMWVIFFIIFAVMGFWGNNKG